MDRPYAGVREGEEVPEHPREGGFKPLPGWGERRLGKDYQYPPEVPEACRIRLRVKRLTRAEPKSPAVTTPWARTAPTLRSRAKKGRERRRGSTGRV